MSRPRGVGKGREEGMGEVCEYTSQLSFLICEVLG